MYRITTHPILPVPAEDLVSFKFEGKTITGQRGQTIAAALHQAGCPVHSLSLDHRKRTMECGIGKCGACEMLVDGKIRRICVTKVDGVREVARLSADSGFKGVLVTEKDGVEEEKEVYKTTVAIIGAGPAGLAVREELLKEGVDCLVIDSNSEIGGQFLMQTHQFFFFEKEKRFGGMRGFDIAKTLAGDSHEGIMLDSVVWDILEGKRLAVKNIATDKVFYVDTDELVIATGAVPFMPAFKNDDVPGVYTAAVVQRMMNTQFTLLGKNILTVGAGNIGYLTSYQAMQAGANVRMIIEGMPREGGFPVQANRVRRLGIPILTSHVLPTIPALPEPSSPSARTSSPFPVPKGSSTESTASTSVPALCLTTSSLSRAMPSSAAAATESAIPCVSARVPQPSSVEDSARMRFSRTSAAASIMTATFRYRRNTLTPSSIP